MNVEKYRVRPRLSCFWGIDGKSVWCPTVDYGRLCLFGDWIGHVNPSSAGKLLLDFLMCVEEGDHRRMFLSTKLRMRMTWLECVSNISFQKVLDLACKYGYPLEIPLSGNLENSNLPPDLKVCIEDTIYLSSLIESLSRKCRPIIEALSLFLLAQFCERTPLDSGDRKLLLLLKQRKFSRYKSLVNIYPKLESALQPFYDKEKPWSGLLEPIRFLFSSAGLEVPVLSPSELSASYVEDKSENPINRLELLTKLTSSGKTEQDFREFALNHNLPPYSNESELRETFGTYEICANTLIVQDKSNYPIFLPLLYPNLKRLCDEDDEYARFWLWGMPIVTLTESEELERYKLYMNSSLDANTRSWYISIVQLTMNKYFLLSGKPYCMMLGMKEACRTCVIRDLARHVRSEIPVSSDLCPYLEWLDGVSLTTQSNQNSCSLG